MKAGKTGLVSALIASSCCILPSLLILAGIGSIGFLINDVVLLPLLALFLFVTIIGLFSSYRIHQKKPALIIGLASTAVMFLFVFPPITYLGIVGLITASVLNVWHQRTHQTKA